MSEAYINSKFVGYIDEPRLFIEKLKEERRKGKLNNNINVYYDNKADNVYVECSKGRARRPLIVVKESQPLLTEKHIKQLEKDEISWSDLIQQGIIEYLDAAEEENCYVAFFDSEFFFATSIHCCHFWIDQYR